MSIKFFRSLLIVFGFALLSLFLLPSISHAHASTFSDNFNTLVSTPLTYYNSNYYIIQGNNADHATVYNGQLTDPQQSQNQITWFDMYGYSGLGSLADQCNSVTGVVTDNFAGQIGILVRTYTNVSSKYVEYLIDGDTGAGSSNYHHVIFEPTDAASANLGYLNVDFNLPHTFKACAIGNQYSFYVDNNLFDQRTFTLYNGPFPILAGNPGLLIGGNSYVTNFSVDTFNPPTVNSFSGATLISGDTYTASGTFTDSDSTSWTATVDYGDGSGVQPLPLSGMNFSLSHQYTTPGTYTVTVSITDDSGETGVGTATVIVHAPNAAPAVNSLQGGTIQEGGTYTEAGSFTDPDSSSWTATVDYGDGSGIRPLTLSGTNFSLSHQYKDNGNFTVTVTVADDQNATGQASATITVNNVAPTVGTITAPSSPAQVNTSITASANFTDPGVLDTHTATWDWGDGSAPQNGTVTESNGSGSVNDSHTYTSYGTYTITLTVTDKDGGVGTQTQQIFVNAPPTGNANGPYTVNEGSNVTLNGTGSDPDGDTLTYTWDLDHNGTYETTGQSVSFHGSDGPAIKTVNLKVCDNNGGCDIESTTVTVNNVTPSVGTITAPSSPVQVNTAITGSANFTDPGVLDTHTASWNWGDGNTTTGTVTENNGSGSVSNTHTYVATGVYTITLTLTDKDGGQGTSTFQYVAVYDSSTSFAGGRSFDNPSNASPSTSGKVTFGVSSKYSNTGILTGSAKMDFKAANIDFASTSITSLATSNGKAYLKGTGTVNGSGNYSFLATGIDGSVVGGNDLIRFQIKNSSGIVVYDSQPGASDTTDATIPVATGNIRVH